jgi:hypothetical protein
MKLCEAADRLSRLGVLAPDGVEWALAVANRNFLIQPYEDINRDLTWLTLARDLPRWKESLKGLFGLAEARSKTSRASRADSSACTLTYPRTTAPVAVSPRCRNRDHTPGALRERRCELTHRRDEMLGLDPCLERRSATPMGVEEVRHDESSETPSRTAARFVAGAARSSPPRPGAAPRSGALRPAGNAHGNNAAPLTSG